ncbi:hypothetical protein OIU74_024386 [Salix koriyanagi]|uniref:Uncharacterized protein n=1 Tax=Salix koriyanagi TaxID=2511006 RepID=A0A9Q0W828_9ROSI|nr:hypothetical protein OIU74_024386 [Salix koriyanagi]
MFDKQSQILFENRLFTFSLSKISLAILVFPVPPIPHIPTALYPTSASSLKSMFSIFSTYSLRPGILGVLHSLYFPSQSSTILSNLSLTLTNRVFLLRTKRFSVY